MITRTEMSWGAVWRPQMTATKCNQFGKCSYVHYLPPNTTLSSKQGRLQANQHWAQCLVVYWLGHRTQQHNGRWVGVRFLATALSDDNLRQLVHSPMCPLPSSINWYRPNGGDALWLGKKLWVWCHNGHASDFSGLFTYKLKGLRKEDKH